MSHIQKRWEPCVCHDFDQAKDFALHFFTNKKKVLFIACAGFDPRSTKTAELLSPSLSNNCSKIVLFREDRPNPKSELVIAAETHATRFLHLFNNVSVFHIDIFSHVDDAVVGGRRIITQISKFKLDEFSDIVIDISAMSIGVMFPLIRYVFNCAIKKSPQTNVHIFAVHSPKLDINIFPIFCDRAEYILGYESDFLLDRPKKFRKFWLPQLSLTKHAALNKIISIVNPDEIYPILPWPSFEPKLPDKLLVEYKNELRLNWNIDPRDMIFASEDDPLDLYRIILDLDDFRHKVLDKMQTDPFLILSPTGSKLMALGSLLAALERDLPVAYLETIGYNLGSDVTLPVDQDLRYYHLWLCGSEAYPDDWLVPHLRTS